MNPTRSLRRSIPTGPGPDHSEHPGPLTYVEQRAADLRYYLFTGVPALAGLAVLAERVVDLGWATARLRIVGASHTLGLVGPGFALTEALVGGLTGSPAAARLCLPVEPPKLCSLRLGPVAVAVRLRVERRTAAELARLEDRLRPARRPGTLVAPYPAPSGQSGLTWLAWRAAPATFDLATYHTYPEERAVVISRTRCRLAPVLGLVGADHPTAGAPGVP